MGDYAGKTADLSLTEHGAYNVLLDTCYTTERPLPGPYESLYRLCRAMTKLEQAAVRSVADRFFPLADDGLRRNKRATEEISKAQVTIAKQRDSGVESAAKRWSTDGSTDGLTNESTHAAAIQPPTSNHQPLTSNHQPPRKKTARQRLADLRFDRFYESYPLHVARGAAEKVWADIAPDDLLAEKICRAAAGYAALVKREKTAPKHIKHASGWLNARRWEDQLPTAAVVPGERDADGEIRVAI